MPQALSSAPVALAEKPGGALQPDSCDHSRTLVALAPGDRLGPYELQALLGAGGMGEVYRGRDTRLGRDVALKVIAPRLADDPAFRRRFELEARAASALNHPSIVTIYDIGETDGRSWIAMEWVEGRTLRHALEDGPLPVGEAWSITRQVAEGLAAAHAKGIVHRDLKPENVMLGLDGRARVLDFGLARVGIVDALEGAQSTVQTVAAPTRATFEGSILGTVGYMSPEQAAGRSVDFRSDQFALGVLAYEMLSGRQAFERPSAIETLSAIIREDPVPLASIRSGISDGFQRVIGRCLAKLPKDRFESSRDLVAALTASDNRTTDVGSQTIGLSSHEIPATVAPGATTAGISRRAVIVVAAALALAGASFAWNRYGATPPATVNSLAVLPFENGDSGPDAEYLGDGLTEALIGQMSQVPSLRVMARGTVFRFKGAKDPQAAGQALGVGAVVTGRVARRGDRLTISAELIEVATGVRLWGETYDGPFADVMRVQDTIASNISEGLRLRLSNDAKRTLAAHGTENAEAYELLLKGRYLLANDTEEDDIAARDLFRQAVEKDPRFVEARLEIAATFIRSAGNLYAPPTDAWARAEEELKIVRSLDPANFRARVNQAVRHFMFDWDWATSETEFQQLSGDPRLFLSTAYHPVAIYNWVRGRPDDAVAVMERALRVDPENLESKVMRADLLVQAGRLDDAVAQYTAIAAGAPNDSRALFGLADVLKRRSDIQRAISTLGKAYELSDEAAGTDALSGARTEADYEAAEIAVARARLVDLESEAKGRYVSPLDIARLHAQVGDREKAFAALDLALAERSPGLVHLKVDAAWDRIRDDQRFVAVVRRVGIP
jgi:eukaryotic-like serine/threonine-protein kinase